MENVEELSDLIKRIADAQERRADAAESIARLADIIYRVVSIIVFLIMFLIVVVMAGNTLTGVDALGVIWNAQFGVPKNGEITFKALLDPKDTPPTVGLMDKNGVMTREPQNYDGVVKITKLGEELILRTQVQQGPITIDVQFRKKA